MPIPPDFAGADASIELSWALPSGKVLNASRPLAEIRAQPPSAEAMRRKAQACRKAGQEREAADWFARILAAPIPAGDVDPYDDALRFFVTATAAENRDPAHVITLAEALLAHTHNRDARTWYTLALAHRLLKHRAEAERCCQEALRLRPGHPTILGTLAEIRAMAE